MKTYGPEHILNDYKIAGAQGWRPVGIWVRGHSLKWGCYCVLYDQKDNILKSNSSCPNCEGKGIMPIPWTELQ